MFDHALLLAVITGGFAALVSLAMVLLGRRQSPIDFISILVIVGILMFGRSIGDANGYGFIGMLGGAAAGMAIVSALRRVVRTA